MIYLNVGIKYCGGCNPRYDRKEFLQTLQKEFDYDFEIAQSDKIYDVLIVLCGCTNCCADYKKIKYRYEKIIIKSDENNNKVKEILNKYST